ncbi:Low temperature viability protein-domain-containing protein [Zychaea mexicana]|uniref:Low temperature viability protein-domain-containing protein n=1 Tax=Zychaea mexicana TaxID=64656 RepID=UPI0022FEACEF|nr:Low temperature viability protein-domain-containing protein [Zychaea mexicana]KAI9491699.1 Low temperature viability protein-domain-containing protein [Zychaea mexicana]
MGRKPFIDRKEAKHYHVVHRSQRDPLINDTEASDRVLKEVIPSNLAKHKTQAEIDNVKKKPEKMDQDEIDRRVGQAAMQGIYFEDTADYDYTQHLRAIGSTTEAVFLEAPKKEEKPKKSSSALEFKDDGDDDKDRKLVELPAGVLPSDIEMNVGVMNQTTGLEGGLQPDMDPRLREIMEALEDEEYVEDGLNEDFFDELDAEGAPYVHEEDEEEDYEEELEDGNYNWEAAFRNFQRGKQRRGSDSDFSDDDDVLERQTKNTGFSVSSSVMHRNAQLSLLDDRFDKIEEEYLREEDEDEYYEQEGQALEERADFESILDDFLDKYEIVGKKMQPKLDGETGGAKLDTIREALLATKLSDNEDDDDNESVATVTTRTQQRSSKDKKESEFVDLFERPTQRRDTWDCQSMLSTYTNLENHPQMIADRGPRKKITINPKTGMPVLVEAPRKKKVQEEGEQESDSEDEEDDEDEDEEERINKGVRRSKAESKEEKKARKAAVKEAKKVKLRNSGALSGAWSEVIAIG